MLCNPKNRLKGGHEMGEQRNVDIIAVRLCVRKIGITGKFSDNEPSITHPVGTFKT